ncbi:unnamed protein product [Protopolystoma xenopodis]|uniref:Uncharacterized protein n=1 Tax=Protopolystoma xenopodis TaxID=117903 RepID=A0A448XA03_9PLAT|nr:unnamed protein product [Protopolystoma xenopodis]
MEPSRLLVEPTVESLHSTLSLEMEVSSMSSDGTDLRISSPNISTRNGSNPNILLVEPTFESLHPTLSLGMEVSSTIVFWWNRPSNLFTQHFHSKWN